MLIQRLENGGLLKGFGVLLSRRGAWRKPSQDWQIDVDAV